MDIKLLVQNSRCGNLNWTSVWRVSWSRSGAFWLTLGKFQNHLGDGHTVCVCVCFMLTEIVPILVVCRCFLWLCQVSHVTFSWPAFTSVCRWPASRAAAHSTLDTCKYLRSSQIFMGVVNIVSGMLENVGECRGLHNHCVWAWNQEAICCLGRGA